MAKEWIFKTETEGLILAAQEQALRTNSNKYSIDKTSETLLCRLCGETTETVRHIVSGCKKLAQREYRKRHDKVALRVHWEMYRKYGIECTNKWYDHQPLSTAENGEVRITWDMTIYTDKALKHNRPDITLMHKGKQKWTLIDIAVPADQNIIQTEEEKVEKYQELAFEIRRIHGASKVDCDWCSRRLIEKIKGLAWQVRCTRLPWKCTVIGHSWNCSSVAKSVVSLSYGKLLRHNQC